VRKKWRIFGKRFSIKSLIEIIVRIEGLCQRIIVSMTKGVKPMRSSGTLSSVSSGVSSGVSSFGSSLRFALLCDHLLDVCRRRIKHRI
jgi:hypothetical protein